MERDINAQGHGFGLLATPRASGGWRATVTSHQEGSHAPGVPRPRSGPFDSGSPLGIVEDGWFADGTTADEALDALQHRIGVAIGIATAEEYQADLDEANRRRRERERPVRPPGQ